MYAIQSLDLPTPQSVPLMTQVIIFMPSWAESHQRRLASYQPKLPQFIIDKAQGWFYGPVFVHLNNSWFYYFIHTRVKVCGLLDYEEFMLGPGDRVVSLWLLFFANILCNCNF